ncbi:ATP-binding protein [Vibrio alginolyticus]|uniref:ATP-binding protein n=1 Tax=Vibrio alginolyticus TaxID=663 RepID=UPI00215CA221|nr:ATP-binding protein [Vibrio alginolyticus]MCR9541516.1 ATP-binding protein [Vibrio alginolyticus]
MNPPIKSTQLTRLGYEYQDLVCIRILVNWYHDRDIYQWVKVESTSLPDAKVSSLDDVIALRADGKYELTQVKFTIDANREDLTLSFDWLTYRTGNGTSLIQKWFKDLTEAVKNSQLGKAELITNRRPDTEVSACLKNGMIDLCSIPNEHLKIIESQLGGKAEAEEFFNNFNFIHSQPTIDNLENQLHDSLVPDHTNEEGWHRFLSKVKRWATRKREPSADGCIRFEDLHSLLSLGVSRDLSQYFDIPEKYLPPTMNFHQDVTNKLETGGAWVVSGAPGMGKSTYLSYLYENLQAKNVAAVRHHYSLGLQSLDDRISFFNAASSIIKQIKNSPMISWVGLDESPENIDKWLVRVGEEASKKGKKFILIVDGLDHVWRERSDISQLEHLINRILPVPEGVTIVFGTQPVSSSKLPNRLLSNCPVEGDRWVDIPYMDLSAIGSWLEGLRDSGVANIGGSTSVSSIPEIALALQQISSGYPLHVIYSLRTLLAKEKNVSVYDIEKLDKCPDGDINTYYWNIWANLSELAKEILYLMAVTEFPWPGKNSFAKCFEGTQTFLEAYKEIEHLVEHRRSGVFPFHGSLLVNIQKRKEFEGAKRRLYPVVSNWLSNDAPSFWRWAWDWIVQSEMKNIDPLLKGVTKEWVINSLCDGYPLGHIEHIISSAEKVAFSNKNYTRLVDLRLMKTRFINGPEYQVQDFSEFSRSAMKHSDDEYGLLWKSDNIRTLDIEDIVAVASLCREKYPEVAENCYQELYKRAVFYANIYEGTENKFSLIVDSLIQVLCDCDDPDVGRVIDLIDRITPKDGLYEKLFSSLLRSDNSEYIFDIDYFNLPEESKPKFLEYSITAACISGIDLSSRDYRGEVLSSSFGVSYYLLKDQLLVHKNFIGPVYFRHKDVSESELLDFFFHTLNDHLAFDVLTLDKEILKLQIDDNYDFSIWFGFYIAAVNTAKLIRNGEKLNPLDIYKYIESSGCKKHIGYDYELHSKTLSVIHAIPNACIKIALLLKEKNLFENIDKKYLDEVQDYSWWSPVVFFQKSVKQSFVPVDHDSANNYWCDSLNDLNNREGNTAELGDECIDIVSISSSLGLKDAVKTGLEQACKYMLGYGYRKDITFHEVFESIQACSDADIGDVADYLKRVSCFTVDMFSFTEREIRHIPFWYMQLLSKHLPSRIYDEFSFHLEEQNWYVLEDILIAYIKNGDVSLPGVLDLIGCFYSYGLVEAIKERSNEDSSLDPVLQEIVEYYGTEPPKPRDRDSSSNIDKEEIKIPFGSYVPEYLGDLIERIRKEYRYSDSSYLSQWIEHWVDLGEGLRVIAEYENFFKDDEDLPYLSGLKESIDAIYQASKKLQGKRRAYVWALRSIRANSYWSRYSGSKSEEMICYYAREYRDRWEELFADSTHGEHLQLRGDEWSIVPTSKLVMFLIAVGQNDLAADVTDVIVRGLERDIEHLPIRESYWLHDTKSKEVWAFSFLLKFYQWPDKAVKKKTAMKIAHIIDNDDSGLCRKEFIECIKSLPNEVSVVEYLSILQLVEKKHFDADELIEAVPFHSLSLKYLFEDLGFYYDEKNLANSYLDKSIYIGISERLKKSLNGVPGYISTSISTLGNNVGADLLGHMSSELEYINSRENYSYFDPYSFTGGMFWLRDHLMCSLSSATESAVMSAYVRTILYAANNYSIDQSEVFHLVQQANPFSELLHSVGPISRPAFWPDTSEIIQNEQLPAERKLKRILDKLACNDDVVLGGSGPVVHQVNGINVDLEVFAVSIAEGCELNASEKFSAIENNQNPIFTGVYPLSICLHEKIASRFEVDKAVRGLYAPHLSLGTGTPYIESNTDGISFKEGDINIAKWEFWYQDWYPARYYGLGPSLGVATIASPNLRFILESSDEQFYLIGRFSVVNKSGFSTDNANTEHFYFESKLKPGQLEALDTSYVSPVVSEYMKTYIAGNRLPRGKMFRNIHIK